MVSSRYYGIYCNLQLNTRPTQHQDHSSRQHIAPREMAAIRRQPTTTRTTKKGNLYDRKSFVLCENSAKRSTPAYYGLLHPTTAKDCIEGVIHGQKLLRIMPKMIYLARREANLLVVKNII